jgi:hypothetical protein
MVVYPVGNAGMAASWSGRKIRKHIWLGGTREREPSQDVLREHAANEQHLEFQRKRVLRTRTRAPDESIHHRSVI